MFAGRSSAPGNQPARVSHDDSTINIIQINTGTFQLDVNCFQNYCCNSFIGFLPQIA